MACFSVGRVHQVRTPQFTTIRNCPRSGAVETVLEVIDPRDLWLWRSFFRHFEYQAIRGTLRYFSLAQRINLAIQLEYPCQLSVTDDAFEVKRTLV